MTAWARLALTAAMLLVTRAAAAQVPETGAGMYRAWCAVCHGADGTGRLPARPVKTPPLDFSDCRLASPETDADWSLVVSHGGPAAGRSSDMPAFEALSAEQVRRLVAHLRTFCSERAWPHGNLNLPRALYATKAFPENEVTVSPIATTGASTYPRLSFGTTYAARMGPRFELEVGLPIETVGWIAGRHNGIGDFSIGGKYVLYASEPRGLIASAGLDVSLPSGSRTWEFGEGTTVFEPFLAVGQIWRGLFLQGHIKAILPTYYFPTEPIRRIAYAAGIVWPFSTAPDSWAVGLEVDGVDGGFGLVPQISKGLTKTGALTATIGVRIPIEPPSPFKSDVTRWTALIVWDFLEPVRARR